jgi:peroxiredoxin
MALMAKSLRMTKLLGLALAFGLAAFAAAPVPRQAADFKLVDASGKETTLAAQKGKVVVIQFLYTWCPHCQATARWLSTMQKELGPKGVQVFGVAFNDGVAAKDVADFKQNATFPVSISPKEPVLKFLGLSVMDGFGVPQLVVIDKKGVVQAQTKPRPAAGEIVEEPIMRTLVNKLLAEK